MTCSMFASFLVCALGNVSYVCKCCFVVCENYAISFIVLSKNNCFLFGTIMAMLAVLAEV